LPSIVSGLGEIYEDNPLAHMGGSDTSRTNHKVVLLGHSPSGLDDFLLVIRDDLDLLEFNTEIKTLLGEKVAVRVAMKELSRVSSIPCMALPNQTYRVLPFKTSSLKPGESD